MSDTQFMGQDMTSVVKTNLDSNGKETSETIMKVTKAGLKAIYEEKGITKEISKALIEADDAIIKEAIPTLSAVVVKTKKPAKLELGSGNNKLSFSLSADKEQRNVKTGDIKTVYGQFQFRQSKVVPRAIKEGQELVDAKKAIAAAFGAK